MKDDWDRGYEAGLAQGAVNSYPVITLLEQKIERLKSSRSQAARDIAYLDKAGSRLGTNMDSVGGIPSEIPGFDIDPHNGADHIHFVLMPIGAPARRAAVKWLKSHNALGKHND